MGLCACLQIGRMMYMEGSPWKADGGAAGAMLAPVAFAMLALLGAVVLLALFLALQVRCEGVRARMTACARVANVLCQQLTPVLV